MVSLFQTLLPEEGISRSDLGTAGYREGEVIRKEKRGVAWEKNRRPAENSHRAGRTLAKARWWVCSGTVWHRA
jgi:hypothetical protein